MRINSNIASLTAQRYMSQTTRALSRALERLASGQCVNSARDNAADFAKGLHLDAEVRGLKQAAQNVREVEGYLLTTQSALQSQSEILQRMRELALSASSELLVDTSRTNLNAEFVELFNEFKRLTETTNFNGTQLLNGTEVSRQILVGSQRGQYANLSFVSTRTSEIFEVTSSSGGSSLQYVGDGTFTQAATGTLGSDVRNAPAFEDFNGDGKIDLAIANYGDGTLSIRLGNGNGTFTNAATVTVGTGPLYSPTVRDINGDDIADILVANKDSSDITVLLGVGDGTFTNAATITAGTNPR